KIVELQPSSVLVPAARSGPSPSRRRQSPSAMNSLVSFDTDELLARTADAARQDASGDPSSSGARLGAARPIGCCVALVPMYLASLASRSSVHSPMKQHRC